MNQGRLCLDEVRKCGTYVLIMFVTSEVTIFHLSLTVVLSFNIKYSSLNVSKCFRMLALSALFLMKMLRLGRHLRLGEMLISINIVLWSATPSTTLSFLIMSCLFVNTISRILLELP